MKHILNLRAAKTRAISVTNLRPSADGLALEAVGLPRAVTSLPLRPLCRAGGLIVAARGSRLFTFDPLHPETNPTLIAALPSGAESYCALGGGNRAIVMTSKGARHITVAGGEAICLGALPGLPEVETELTEAAELTETVAGITLTDPDALRSGALAPADAAALTAGLRAAWERIVARARASGAVIVPAEGAAIMAETRRTDASGAAVDTTGPRPVGAPGSASPTAIASIAAGAIAPFTLSVKVYRLRVTIGAISAEDAAAWGAEAGGVVVAVTAAPAVTVSWTMRVERPASGEGRLAVTTLIAAPAPAADLPRQTVAVAPAGSAATELTVSIPEAVTEPVGPLPAPGSFIARRCGASGDIVVWADIDGAPGDVAVAPAASPLAVTLRQTLSQAPIAAIEAAPRLGSAALSPGCAHFYAFTGEGILSVSVGARRSTLAASLLDRAAVSRPEAVGAGAGRVVALTDDGRRLINLRGGRADELERLHSCFIPVAAAIEPLTGEVWLLDAAGNTEALDPATGFRSRRPLPFAPARLTACGGRLYLTAAEGLYDASAEETSSEVMIDWRAGLGRPAGEAVVVMGLEAPGGFDGHLDLYPRGFSSHCAAAATPPLSIAVRGALRSPLPIRLFIPPRGTLEGRIHGSAAPGTRLYDLEILKDD